MNQQTTPIIPQTLLSIHRISVSQEPHISHSPNTHYGLPLEEYKEDNHTRISSLNINGLALSNTGGKLQSVLLHTHEYNIDIFALQETQIDTQNQEVKNICYQETQKLSNLSHRPKLTISSSPVACVSYYKAGGTAILSAGRISSRRTQSGTDWLGRWSWQRFSGKNGMTCTIVSCYQVTEKNINPSSVTFASQQLACLREKGIKQPNPRKQFYIDLNAFLQETLTNPTDELLLLGDFNECFYEHNSNLMKIADTHNLYDITFQISSSINFGTYNRGHRRIDFALGTKRFYDSYVQGGYQPFGEHLSSDHRAYYMDFNNSILFGQATPQSIKPVTKITYQNKTQGLDFLEDLSKLVESRNLYSRAQYLESLEEPNHSLAEQLNQDMTTFCLTAQKRNINQHTAPWTLQIIKLKARITICHLVISMHRTRINMKPQINKYDKNFGPFEDIPVSYLQARAQLPQLKQLLHTCRKDSIQKRKAEQDERIAKLEFHPHLSEQAKAIIIRRIQRAETMRRVFKKLDCTRNNKSGDLLTLKVPINPNDNPKIIANEPHKWKGIHDASAQTTKIIEQNINHFGQAQLEQTPLFQHPLQHMIDFKATTIHSETILKGKFSEPTLDKTTHQMIQAFESRFHSPISQTLTLTDVKGKIKNWNENTSVSPISGLHLGIWKIIFCDHLYLHEKTQDDADGPNKIKFDTIQQKLQQIWLILLNYAIKFSYSYKRWKTIVTRMILKSEGDYRIHRLRVIHLYEADFSLLCAVFWRKLLYQTVDNNQVNTGLYGMVPNRNAHMPPFMDNMMKTYWTSHVSSIAGVAQCGDATNSYNAVESKYANSWVTIV